MPIKTESLSDFGIRNISGYATEVNLDRAIPELYDGLKPVLRRVAWSMNSFKNGEPVKSAKAIGHCIGSYHPHGDVAAYGAMQTMVHHNVPLLEGIGNWGGLLDPAAAMRYCFVGSTRINTEKGLLKISTLAKRSRIGDRDNVPFSILVDTKNKPCFTSHFVNSGIQNVVEVITNRGYRTTCTPNEPFYVITRDGFRWIRADQLKKGDWLCLKRGTNLKVKGSHNLPIEYAKFLGYMVGDGYMNRGQNYLGFNQVDEEIFNDFLNCAKVFLKDYVDSFTVTDKEPRSYGKKPYKDWVCCSVKAKAYCAKYGLYEGDSYDRKVPECIFKGSTEFMQAFLQALFECDGSVSRPKNAKYSSNVTLSSVNKDLLEDVSLILRSQFGIFSTVCLSNRARTSHEYKLNITGAENVLLFKEHVGFISERKNSAFVINKDALFGKSIGGGCNDCIPYAKCLKLSRSENTRRSNFRQKVSTGKLTSHVANLLYDRDYFYCKVEKVVDAGEAQVWDLTVPSNHSFVADGFIVHNTNVKLSKLGASVFESDYLAVTDMVPNYDNTTKEPVVLPVRLPLLVLNGADGIGVGITCSIPTFTVESVVEVLTKLFSGSKLEPKDYAQILKPKQPWGGHLVKSAANKKAWLELMETGKAKVFFESTLIVDEAKKTITISEWPAGLSVEKFVQKVRLFPECQRCYNSKGSVTFTIECKKTYNLPQFQAFVEKVRKLTRVAASYKLNVTHRVSKTEDGVTSYSTEFLALSVAEFFMRWCRLRLQLEKRCLEFRIARQEKLIAYSKLLIFACSKLPVIFKALKVKDSAGYLVDNLGITLEQANQILDLKVRALSKLDQDALKAKLREQESILKGLNFDYRHPKKKLVQELPELLTLIREDTRTKDKRFNQQLTVH